MRANSTANVLICLTIALSILSGCSTKVAPVEIQTSPAIRPTLVLPAADVIKTRPVQWIVITEDNYQEVFAKLTADGKDVVLFGLTDEGYKNLSLNVSDLRTYIEQKNAIIIAYKTYYTQAEDSLNTAVVLQ